MHAALGLNKSKAPLSKCFSNKPTILLLSSLKIGRNDFMILELKLGLSSFRLGRQIGAGDVINDVIVCFVFDILLMTL